MKRGGTRTDNTERTIVMNQNICNICGANFENRNGRWKCPACGAFKPEEITNEELTLLFVADQKRRLSDFDDAERAYSDIIEKYPQNPYGYWGRLLCKHGIKYERDYDGTMIPTCCAPSIERLFFDRDCLSAIDLADNDTKQYFTRQAEYIERVRTVWEEKAKKEKPYDIFICYKDSDLANGIERTADSIEAQDIYLHLISQGYRVFFSRESLRDKTGERYEPYIFNALSSAKVMLVYGKSSDYITSTWLKNEWTRYLKMMKIGRKRPNSLIVAYEGFSPSELPTPLSVVQCLDASRKTFYTDLDKIIKSTIAQGSKQKQNANFTFPRNNVSALVCPNCGGDFSASDLLDGDSLVTCLVCGKTYYTADIMNKKSSPEKSQQTNIHQNNKRDSYFGKTVDIGEEKRQFTLFVSQLKELDNQKTTAKKRTLIAQIEESKANLIRSYLIPESLEVILDFFLFAVSNVDIDTYNLFNNNGTRIFKAKKELAQTWVSKIDESYEKAQTDYSEYREYCRIETAYKRLRKSINVQRAKYPVIMISLFLVAVLLPLSVIGLTGGFSNKDSDNVDDSNKTTVSTTVVDDSGLIYDDEHVSNDEKSDMIPDVDYTSSDDDSSKLIIENEPQIESSSNITITKGSEYTYMCDEWNLYVIKAISSTIVKVEKWGKIFSSSKTVRHEYDVGSFDITDSSNGFIWMDDNQTAFYFNLKDSKTSEFRKGKTVFFSISNSDSDKNKGTNYVESEIAYSYTNDDWHMYRAVQISNNLMKIECWYRSMAIGSFGYGYDVIIVNLNSADANLQWTDEERTSFTISLSDVENSNLKNAKMVLFEKE